MYYRTYRPQKFTEISKPNEIAETLQTQLRTGKTAQAYLFTGSRGTGKTTTARILAKALNCKKLDKNGDPCDACESCLAIKEGNYLDLIEIDAASNRGIDDIRDLKDKVKLAPALGKRKIYIIDEVHMLTNEAFNALLKTLEEPPKHSTFILCTTELHKVPETIKSRCQVYKFKRATVVQLVTRLEGIAKQEGAKISKEDLKKIAVAASGGFRDADTLLQQVIEGDLDVNAVFMSGSLDVYHGFVVSLLANDANSAISVINKVYEDGADLTVWTTGLLKYLRDLLLISAGASEGIVDTTEEMLSEMTKQAVAISTGQITQMLEVFLKANNLVKNSSITQLPLEIAIVTLCAPGNDFETKKPVTPKPAPAGNVKKEEIKPTKKQEDAKPATVPPKNTSELKEKAKIVAPPEESESLQNDDADVTSSDEVQVEVVTNTNIDIVIEVTSVKERWTDVLNEVVKKNSSVQALLKSSTPVKTEGNYVVLEVFYSFHKERLEHPKNRLIVEGALKEIFGQNISIKCEISNEKPVRKGKESGILTDYNVSGPVGLDDPALKGSILEVFDGGLPLMG